MVANGTWTPILLHKKFLHPTGVEYTDFAIIGGVVQVDDVMVMRSWVRNPDWNRFFGI